jgi:hypothetical protein
LPPLVLSHAIENQNSDFVKAKAQLALCLDEVRILIFDDTAEHSSGGNVQSFVPLNLTVVDPLLPAF